MERHEREALDRHITGNYGEGQFSSLFLCEWPKDCGLVAFVDIRFPLTPDVGFAGEEISFCYLHAREVLTNLTDAMVPRSHLSMPDPCQHVTRIDVIRATLQGEPVPTCDKCGDS